MAHNGDNLREQLLAMEKAHEGLLDVIADLRVEIEDLQLENEDQQERASLIRELIERAPDAFFVHDLKGRFVFMNQASCELLGYSKEEVLSTSVQDVETGISPEQMRAHWDAVVAGETVHTEGLLRRRDGSHVPVESWISSTSVEMPRRIVSSQVSMSRLG